MIKNKLRKRTVMLMSSILAMTTLAGCGGTQVTTGEKVEKKNVEEQVDVKTENKNITLSYVVSQNWVNKGSKVDDELNKKFEEETGIKIDMQVIPDDQYVNVLKTKMGTGEVPDIFMVSAGVGAEKFMPEKYFADLSNEAWVERYAEYAKQGSSINGKVMGMMTWCVDGWGILYNKQLYDELGLTVPKNCEEFSKVCDVLMEKGVTPVFESGKDAWHWAIWLSQYGPYAEKKNPDLYQKLNKNEVKFAEVGEFEEFLTDLKQCYDKGYLGQNSLAEAWDASYEGLGTGKSAGFLGYQSYQLEVADKYPDSEADKWEMYPIPFAGNDMYSHSAGGNMRVAYKDSPNLEYAKEYFDFLAQPENLKLFYEGRSDLQPNPSFVDVPGHPTLAGESISKNAPGGQGIDMEYGVMFWDNTTIGKYIQEMVLGSKTPKQVLEAIDEDRQKMFSALEK